MTRIVPCAARWSPGLNAWSRVVMDDRDHEPRDPADRPPTPTRWPTSSSATPWLSGHDAASDASPSHRRADGCAAASTRAAAMPPSEARRSTTADRPPVIGRCRSRTPEPRRPSLECAATMARASPCSASSASGHPAEVGNVLAAARDEVRRTVAHLGEDGGGRDPVRPESDPETHAGGSAASCRRGRPACTAGVYGEDDRTWTHRCATCVNGRRSTPGPTPRRVGGRLVSP